MPPTILGGSNNKHEGEITGAQLGAPQGPMNGRKNWGRSLRAESIVTRLAADLHRPRTMPVQEYQRE
jgi:hypothetical protein